VALNMKAGDRIKLQKRMSCITQPCGRRHNHTWLGLWTTLCGIKTHHIFGHNWKKGYPSHVSHQMAVQFSISPNICFCTTWGKKTNKILNFNHFGIIS